MKQINLTNEEITNFITAMNYLKDLLATTDVSEDFASNEDDCVTAWSLLNDQPLMIKLTKALDE